MTNYRDNEELHLALRKQQDGSRALEIRDAEGNSISRTTLGAQSDSPSFTGDPNAPTANQGDDDLSIATTHFVKRAIDAQHVVDNGAYASLSALAPVVRKQRAVRPTVMTAFQASHGWTTGGTGVTWNLNDTTDKYVGSQSVSGVTGGAGGQSWVQSPAFTALDVTNLDFIIWVKVDSNIDALKRIAVILTPDNFTTYLQGNGIYDGAWPAAPTRQMRQGEWFPLAFNQGMLKDTRTASGSLTAMTRMRLTFEDKADGRTVAFKVGRVDYYTRTTAYPNGIITFSFDDSFKSLTTNVAPYLAKYGFPATAYPIADMSDNPGSTWTSTADLLTLQETYGWEISSHAYTLANHNAGFNTLDTASLDAELRNLKSWGLANGFRGADHLAYPLGYHAATTDPAVRKYFSTGRTIYSNPHETMQPQAPLRMRARGVGSADTVVGIQAEVDRAVSSAAWLHLVFHDVTSGTATNNQVTVANFQAMVDYIATKNAAVLPVGDVWRTTDR